MKKVLTIAIVFVMLMMTAMSIVNAATSETLADELYAIGSKYGMTAGNKVEMERYLESHSLSEEKCNEILSLAKEAEQIMVDNNTTDVKSLPKDVKARLIDLANRAAAIAGVTLNIKSDSIDVIVDGEVFTTLSLKDTIPYTGNTMNVTLIVSSVAVIALAVIVATVATKKRLAANA